MFTYSTNRREGVARIRDVSGEESWRTIRDELIKNVGLNSVPVIMVKELERDGTLVLLHEHDGRDLELAEANKVFSFINDLWSGNIRFTTIIEDEEWEF